MVVNNFSVRTKVRLVYESYLYFSMFELLTGVKAKYKLTSSVCLFPVTFKREKFVSVENFYNHLKKSFDELKLEAWGDFKELYDYNVDGYVTYAVFCTRKKPITLKYFRDTINTYFREMLEE